MRKTWLFVLLLLVIVLLLVFNSFTVLCTEDIVSVCDPKTGATWTGASTCSSRFPFTRANDANSKLKEGWKYCYELGIEVTRKQSIPSQPPK